jgi:DUF218 domain
MSEATAGPRLVAVLGYSIGRGDDLHEICAARLRRAEEEVRRDDVVLLSGWARRRRRPSEAELMARSWRGRGSRVVLDRTARSTLANAVGVAATARALAAHEIVLVTSRWHGRRAAALLAAALRGTGVEVELALTEEAGSVRARAREAVCWAFVPIQLVLAGRHSVARALRA